MSIVQFAVFQQEKNKDQDLKCDRPCSSQIWQRQHIKFLHQNFHCSYDTDWLIAWWCGVIWLLGELKKKKYMTQGCQKWIDDFAR